MAKKTTKPSPPIDAPETLPASVAKRPGPEAKRLPVATAKSSPDVKAKPPRGASGAGGDKKLSAKQVEAIRQLALAMAGLELADDAVLICTTRSLRHRRCRSQSCCTT